ncbi:MAG: hypothetical protein C5S52_08380 [ANME-2 cluster archaeon]|nr:hypothetical protein [ANME-2 cluster archaeon]
MQWASSIAIKLTFKRFKADKKSGIINLSGATYRILILFSARSNFTFFISSKQRELLIWAAAIPFAFKAST